MGITVTMLAVTKHWKYHCSFQNILLTVSYYQNIELILASQEPLLSGDFESCSLKGIQNMQTRSLFVEFYF